MADKIDEEEVSWWDWAVTTKDKVVNQSTEVMGYVQKDINEFTKVISNEASAAVSSTATILKEKLNLDDHATTSQMKQSVSGFFNHVAQAFTPPPEDSDAQAIMICNQKPVFLNKEEVAVYQLYSDHSNFLTDADGEEEAYEAWLLNFNIEDHQHELSTLLLNNETLRQTYTKLVPTQVNHNVFWHRYYYKMHKIKEGQSMREEMKLRMENSIEDNQETLWDEDEEFGGDNEIPELIQNKLIEEYAQECRTEQEIGFKTIPEIDSLTPDPSIHSEIMNETPFEEIVKDNKSISPVSSKDTDDSWEKLQTSEAELQKTSSSESIKEQSSNKGEDWQNWE